MFNTSLNFGYGGLRLGLSLIISAVNFFMSIASCLLGQALSKGHIIR